jgi:hypothetical protein
MQLEGTPAARTELAIGRVKIFLTISNLTHPWRVRRGAARQPARSSSRKKTGRGNGRVPVIILGKYTYIHAAASFGIPILGHAARRHRDGRRVVGDRQQFARRQPGAEAFRSAISAAYGGAAAGCHGWYFGRRYFEIPTLSSMPRPRRRKLSVEIGHFGDMKLYMRTR